MDTQEDPARLVVTPGAVTAVLDLARARRDTTATVPVAWGVVTDRLRAVLVAPVAGPVAPADGTTGRS